MLSPLPSTLRLRTRSLVAFLLAISAVVLVLRGGYFRAVATGFIAAANPRVPDSAAGLNRAAAKMEESAWLAKNFVNKVENPDRGANMAAAAAARAQWDARNPFDQGLPNLNNFEDTRGGMLIRGFLGGVPSGKAPKIWDWIADPNIAFDSRYPQTPEREAALQARKAYAARNPLTDIELRGDDDQRNAQAIPFLKPNPEFES